LIIPRRRQFEVVKMLGLQIKIMQPRKNTWIWTEHYGHFFR